MCAPYTVYIKSSLIFMNVREKTTELQPAIVFSVVPLQKLLSVTRNEELNECRSTVIVSVMNSQSITSASKDQQFTI